MRALLTIAHTHGPTKKSKVYAVKRNESNNKKVTT